MRKHNISVIYATTPFPSAIVAGYILSKLTRLPLVVDYRNPWNSSYWARKNLKVFEIISYKIEKTILSHARNIITLSVSLEKELRKSYPNISLAKYIVIPNGYDSEEKIPINANLYEQCTLTHAGHLYHKDDTEDLLSVVAEMVDNETEMKKSFRLLFLGAKPESNLFEKLQSLGVAEHRKRLPREKCLEVISRSHALLVFLNKSKQMPGLMMPSKIFDAMKCKKPVFALMDDGEEKQLIEAAGLGTVANYGEKDKIKRHLYDVYQKYKVDEKSDHLFNDDLIKKYERKELTRKLANVFDDLSVAVKG